MNVPIEVMVQSTNLELINAHLPVYTKFTHDYGCSCICYFEEDGSLKRKIITQNENDFNFQEDEWFTCLTELEVRDLHEPNSNQAEFDSFKRYALDQLQETF